MRLGHGVPRGSWNLRLHTDPEGPAVRQVAFLGEDFVPEKIDFDLAAPEGMIDRDTPVEISLNVRYLYGAPGADLRVNAELILRMNMNPFEQWKSSKFGLVQEEFRQRRITLKPLRTSADGKAAIAVKLDDLPATTRPLAALLRVSVLESGGRATVRTVRLPVHGSGPMIGIKPTFGGALQENKNGEFEIVAVASDGKPVAAGDLSYELIREEYRYHWYYRNSRWNYRVTIEEGEYEGYVVKRTDAQVDDLPPGESALIRSLFPAGAGSMSTTSTTSGGFPVRAT